MKSIAFWHTVSVLLSIALLSPPMLNISEDENRLYTEGAPTCKNLSIADVSAIAWYRTNVPARTIDNSFSTRWANYGTGSWIKYDLGQAQTICSVDVAWYRGSSRAYNFVVSASLDGSTFTDVYSGKSSKVSSLQRYDIPDTEAKFVRLTVNGNSANSWAEITEVDIFGFLPDTLAPSITIAAPGEGSSLYPGPVEVTGSASDEAGGSGVREVEVYLDGSGVLQATPNAPGDWSSWSAVLDISTGGTHAISARATDGSNNSNEVSVSVQVILDNTGPEISFGSPADGSEVIIANGVPLQVSGTSFDPESGVSSVELDVDNAGTLSPATPLAPGDWSSWTSMVSIESNGTHTITARAADDSGNLAFASVVVNASVYMTGLDAFGIKMIYPTKYAKEWYVAMDDPRSDPYFRNLQNLQLTQQPDGSWQVYASNGQIRLESWSHADEKWLNVEITEYAKINQTTNSLLQMYSRGGHHSSSDPCLGSAYKARLYGDGRAGWVKEVTHPAYTPTIGFVQATDTRLENRWVGFKAVIYNFVENGTTYVRLESYIDDDVTGPDGSLVIGNDWKLASVTEDRGGWGTTNSDFKADCAPMSVDNTAQYRQRDEILSLPGGTGTQNIAAWRTDQTTWDFKYLSVREIEPPS